MAEGRPEDQSKGVSDALRDAVERTFAATAGSAAGTRDRAGELLDEVTRRGSGALDEVTRRGTEALDEVTRRGSDARGAVGDAVSALRKEVESLRSRLTALESKGKPKDKG